MAGLFGDFMNMDDPIVQMSLGLLGAQGSNFGGNLAQAAMFAQQQREAMEKRKREQGQLEMQQMQLEQMKRQQQEQEQKRQLAQRFMTPGVQNLTPNDDMGNPMPSSPPGFDFGGYATALAGQDPMASLQFQQLLAKEKPKAHVLSPGQIVKDETGRELARGDPKQEGPKIGELRKYDSGDKHYTYEWTGKEWKKIADAPRFKQDGPEKPEKPPQGYRWTADGNLAPIPGGPAEKQASEAELSAAGYGGRMSAAEKIIGKVGAAGQPTTGTVMASALPLPAAGKRFAERQVMDPAQQQYRQAQEDWVRAKLRKESGAVIADDEMQREIETYFPQYGDSPEVIKQKATARQIAIRAMSTASGRAEKQVDKVSGGWSIKPL
jgi:hypothetical protein